jgi:hypothetical protein
VRVVILCQEEPVFLGPFLREVIRARPGAVAAVVVAGRRSAGERGRTLRERVEALRTFWLILEPLGFLAALALRLRARLLGARDPVSVEGVARRLGVPVHRLASTGSEALVSTLAELRPDVVLNQSEILLGPDVLAIPRLGFLNRHASLLPAHRGRLGSFWAHAAEPPSYGVTIHRVDEGIDTGNVLERWEALDVDPAWPFPTVLRHLNARAPALFWSAFDRLERGEGGRAQPPGGEPPRRFPTLEEARLYRTRLSLRRRRTNPT